MSRKMTLNDLRNKHLNDKIELDKAYKTAVEERLKELNLDGLVKRISDGKTGYLELDDNKRVEFFPLTKSGKRGKLRSGWIRDAETEFKPVPEDEKPMSAVLDEFLRGPG